MSTYSLQKIRISDSARTIKNQSTVVSEGFAKSIATNMIGRVGGRIAGTAAGVTNKFGLRGAGVVGGAIGQALVDRHEAKKKGIKPPPFVSVKNFKNLKKSTIKSAKGFAKNAAVKGALTAASVGTGGVGGLAAIIGGRMVLDKGINKSVAHVKNKIALRKLNKQKLKAEKRDHHSASFMNNHAKSSKLPSTPTNSNIKSTQIDTQSTTNLKTGKIKRCPAGTSRNSNNQCVMV